MSLDVLGHLGLTVEQTGELTGQRRSRLIGFLLRWEQYETALTCLEHMFARSPTSVSLLDAKARAFLGTGQPPRALAAMKARHELSSSLTSRALEAQILTVAGNTDAALRIANELVAERPETLTAWRLLGEMLVVLRDWDGALQAYGRVRDLRPDSRAYLLGMLAYHEARGDYVSASGYAVRLQRPIAEGKPLPARTLRRLRDFYGASGQPNRFADMETALADLYQSELAELQFALAEVLVGRDAQPRPTRSPARPHTEEPQPAPTTVPLPPPDVVPVSDRERQHLLGAARELFGFDSLLPGQAETMVTCLRNEDVLTILPTGGGKSLCYQLPALMDDKGTTLVISPLIALMKDQLDSLPSGAGRLATTINSSLEGDELGRRMRSVQAGKYRLVYAAPERLRQPPFLFALRKAGINRMVVDEAHCVSIWGHDFRPDYLNVARARQALGNPPVLAMTATAPPRVRRDIVRQFEAMAAEGARMAVVAADVFRPNLYLAAIRARNADEKLRYLLTLCEAETGSGIIYAGTRDRCEEIAALLRSREVSAGYYHAGIGDRTARSAAQDAFMGGRVRIMVATVAFGMGIDKADIRFIIHWELPSSLEAYYQEAGRAGRDGLPARCVLLYGASDRATLTRRARRDALAVDFVRKVHRAVQRRLGNRGRGRLAMGDLMRDVQAEQTPVRVALSNLEEAGVLRCHQDVPSTAVLRLRRDAPASTPDSAWAAFLTAARLRPGQPLPVDLVDVAQRANLDATDIEWRVLTWVDQGWLDYRPAGRELLVQMLAPPDDLRSRMEALIELHATIQTQRVDEIAAYADTKRCRHGHIGAYLTGQSIPQCRSCDNCSPDAFPLRAGVTPANLPDETRQLETILGCVSSAPWSWGPGMLVGILRGSFGRNLRTGPEAKQRAQESPQWGALRFRSQSAIDGLVDRLVHAGLLSTRRLTHGGTVLDLTPAGRAALEDPTRLAALAGGSTAPGRVSPDSTSPRTASADEESVPADEGLLRRLRAWKRQAAHEAGVPAHFVAHDSVLRSIAAARPQNELELRQINGIGPKKMAQYGAAILEVVREGAGRKAR